MTNTIVKKPNGNGYPASFGNVVDDIFQNTFRRFFDGNFWDDESTLTNGTVPVNIRENEQQYELDVIAPGCRKEDFSIQVHDNLLTVSLQQKKEQPEQREKGWVRNEFIQRPFTRSFTVDDTVDLNNITATYSDGILRLALGKSEKAKNVSRNIEIR